LKDFVSRKYVAREVGIKFALISNHHQVKIYVRSSDVNRTLASASSNMIGFFDREDQVSITIISNATFILITFD
jgi:hypothetical protein